MPRFVTSRTIASLGGASTKILSPAQRRKRIILCCQSTQAYFVTFGEPAGNNLGIMMPAGIYTPLILTDEDLGESINQQVNALGIGAGAVLSYAEVNDT